MPWIKTKDKLPKEGQKIIYYFKWVGVHRGEFTKFKIGPLPELDCFRSKIGWLCGDVTHWMPDEGQELPEAPEEGE